MSLPPGRNPRETNPWPNEKPGFIAAHKDRNSDQMHPTTGKNGGYDTNVISSSSDTHLVDIKNKLIAAPATEAKQDIIIQHVDGLETAVAGTNARIDDVKSNTAAAASKLDIVISHVDGLEAALGTPTSPEAEGDGPAIGHLRRIKNAIVNLAADIVAGTRAILVAGSDGTKARAIRTATDGTVLTQLSGSTVADVVVLHDGNVLSQTGGQMTVKGKGAVVLYVEKNRLGYLRPEVSKDGATWTAVVAENFRTGGRSGRVYGVGTFVVDVTGWDYFRCPLVQIFPNAPTRVKAVSVVQKPVAQGPDILQPPKHRPDTLRPLATSIIPASDVLIQDMNPLVPGVVYGRSGPNALKSTDWGATWPTLLHSAGAGITMDRVYRLPNGSLVVGASNGKVWRSDSNEANFVQVLDLAPNMLAGSFGIRAIDNNVVLAEYGARDTVGLTHKIWLSRDYGVTWTVIFTGLDQVGYHLHDVCIDPYENIIWACNGDWDTTANVIWSNDWGKTWNTVWEYGYAPTHFTQILPLPNCVLFLSDTPQCGVYRWDRLSAGIQSASSIDIVPAQILYPHNTHEFLGNFATFTTNGVPAAYFGFGQYFQSVRTLATVYATTNGYDFYPIWNSELEPTGTAGYRGIRHVCGPSTDGFLGVALLGSNRARNIKLKMPEWKQY